MPGHRFSDEQRRGLKSGEWLDILDPFRVWCKARVLDTVEDIDQRATSQIFITYLGWGSKWDEWIDASSPRIQPWRSFTGSHWTGGPDHPFGPLPGAEQEPQLSGGGPYHPTPESLSPSFWNVSNGSKAKGRKRTNRLSGLPRKSLQRMQRKWLRRLVLDREDLCLYDVSCCGSCDCDPFNPYETPDEVDDAQLYDYSEEDKPSGETQDAGLNDELCAPGKDNSEIFPSLDCNDGCSSEGGDCPEVDCADSFSLISDKYSENSSWVAEGYCASDVLSVSSNFDIVSISTTISGVPKSTSELSLRNDEWDMLRSSDDALVDRKPISAPYRDALLKKGSTPSQVNCSPGSGKSTLRDRTESGRNSQIRVPRRAPLARIVENINTNEGTKEEEGFDEAGGSDWLEDLRDQVKNTAGGKPDRRYKGNVMKDSRRRKEQV